MEQSTQGTKDMGSLRRTGEADARDSASAEGLDWYDLMLTQTFPASDALPLWY